MTAEQTHGHVLMQLACMVCFCPHLLRGISDSFDWQFMKIRKLTFTSFFRTCTWRDVREGKRDKLEISCGRGQSEVKLINWTYRWKRQQWATFNLPIGEELVSVRPWLQDRPQQQHQSTCLPPWGGSSQHCQKSAKSTVKQRKHHLKIFKAVAGCRGCR